MIVTTYPEDILIALSDLLIVCGEDVVNVKYLLEWSKELVVVTI